jgi:GWxTD domain-containing protein
MPFNHSTIRTAVLLFPLFCGGPILAQDEPPPNGEHSNPVQMGVTGESKHHRCFEQPHGAKEAVHRLAASARNWLAEDAIYIITPEERCAFLRVETDEERNQFIEQFWYRRASDPISLDYDFKAEHYRRIVFANEKYGGHLAGWKTDRGRVYVPFGLPDSLDVYANRGATDTPPSKGSQTDLHPAEKWHYKYVQGLGENVQFEFEYKASYKDYFLSVNETDLLARADPNPELPCDTGKDGVICRRISISKSAVQRFGSNRGYSIRSGSGEIQPSNRIRCGDAGHHFGPDRH